MAKTEKKKMNWWKKLLFTIVSLLLVLAIAAGIWFANSTGQFSRGNNKEYYVSNTEQLKKNELTGKKIIFLGSSVTYGYASGGESFVDFLEQRDGIIPLKEAVSGTTLVDEHSIMGDSYITRMKTINKEFDADAFVCQLSTNDATQEKEMGEISDSFDRKDFDTLTVAGVIEYIIAYAKDTWNCPVIFYTGTKYDSEQYGEMVDLLLDIQKKWDIGVLDLWNDPDMNAVSEEDYDLYMVGGIHPSRAGYREWWTPKFEAFLTEFLSR